MQRQLAGLGRGQAVGHQRLAGRIDEPGGEAAAEYPESEPQHRMGEAEQAVAEHRDQTTRQQDVAPPQLVGQPAAIEADQGGDGRSRPSMAPMAVAERPYSR